MNFEKRPVTDRSYMEMIYSLLTEINGVITSQLRNMTNTMGKILMAVIDIQNSITLLNKSTVEYRDQRIQDEINKYEAGMESLKKQIEGKKTEKIENQKTSQDIEGIAIKAAENIITLQREMKETEQETILKKRKEAVITAVWVTLSVGAVLAVLSAFAPIIKQAVENFLK